MLAWQKISVQQQQQQHKGVLVEIPILTLLSFIIASNSQSIAAAKCFFVKRISFISLNRRK